MAQWIAEVDRGRLYPYEGNYSTYLEKKAERLEVQGKKDAKLAKRLKTELEWVRSNAKGRQVKSKARLARYEEMAAEADRTRKLDFEEIQIPPGPRLGSTVIEVKNLQQGLRRPRRSSTTCPSRCRATASSASSAPTASARRRCSRPSSASRSPTAATVKVGETVKISYVDQSRGGLDPKKNLWEIVSDGLDYIKVGHVEIPSRAYVVAVRLQGPRPAEDGRRALRW